MEPSKYSNKEEQKMRMIQKTENILKSDGWRVKRRIKQRKYIKMQVAKDDWIGLDLEWRNVEEVIYEAVNISREH